MIQVIYPTKKPSIKTENGKEYIFCCIRKRWFIITPEEWVRQNFLLFLIETKYCPASLIAVEKQIIVGEVKKRFDIIVYKNDVPFIIVECKEMTVPLTQKTINQVLLYNIHLQAKYMIITNGNNCVGFVRLGEGFEEIYDLEF